MSNQTNEDLLMESAKIGDLDKIKFLFENGTDIHTLNNYSICLASENGHLEVVKFLFENGANICAKNNYSICYASGKGHLKIVNFLFENGADICAENNLSIRFAANNGHLDVVKFILNQYENNDNLIYLLNEIYDLKLNFNENLINKIYILIWSIKLDKYQYFKEHFNEEYEIYDFIFNHKFGKNFNEFMDNNKHLKNKYINLQTICL